MLFRSHDKLQQAAMMYIASQLMNHKEKENLTAIFMSLDKNGDGSLTKEELLEGYTELYGNKERARNEVESLMAIADVDNPELEITNSELGPLHGGDRQEGVVHFGALGRSGPVTHQFLNGHPVVQDFPVALFQHLLVAQFQNADFCS